jgi:hypothetical protein
MVEYESVPSSRRNTALGGGAVVARVPNPAEGLARDVDTGVLVCGGRAGECAEMAAHAGASGGLVRARA